VSDRSQSKVPIFVFVVGAILLGAAAVLSVLVTAPSPGGRTPPAVSADRASQPKPAPAAANDTVTEPVNTDALAGHEPEPQKDEESPAAVAIASEPAAAEPMSDADLAEIRAATRAAAEVAAAEAPSIRPDDAHEPSAETADPIVTAAAPHAANAGEPEASVAEPHAPASLSGATAQPAKNEDAEKRSAPAPAATAAPPSDAPPAEPKAEDTTKPDQARGPEPTAEAKAKPEPSQPAPLPAEAADDRGVAAPDATAGTTTEPAATKPTPPGASKPEHVPPTEPETAEIKQPPVPAAAPLPERASRRPVEAEPAPPMPSRKVVQAAPEVPKPEKADARPPAAAASANSSDDKREAAREAARSRQAAQPAETRQAETKPGVRPMTLGFSGGLFKPKAAPAQRARGKSSRAYGAAVRDAVGHHKPRGVGRGRVTVTFSIGPMGALRGVSVARSSGNSQLDQAALAAIRSAAPFPAPPSGAGQTYSLPISFH
jgi:protein TonB